MPAGHSFRDPEIAFLAAERLKLRQAVRPRYGPRKVQGTAAARARRVKQGKMSGRLHDQRRHWSHILSFFGGSARKSAGDHLDRIRKRRVW
jgi:hypothetical protein